MHECIYSYIHTYILVHTCVRDRALRRIFIIIVLGVLSHSSISVAHRRFCYRKLLNNEIILFNFFFGKNCRKTLKKYKKCIYIMFSYLISVTLFKDNLTEIKF